MWLLHLVGGMICADRTGYVHYLPAIPAETRDACGAGDTVLASLGVAMLMGCPLRQACGIASMDAAQQVSHTGLISVKLSSESTGAWQHPTRRLPSGTMTKPTGGDLPSIPCRDRDQAAFSERIVAKLTEFSLITRVEPLLQLAGQSLFERSNLRRTTTRYASPSL